MALTSVAGVIFAGCAEGPTTPPDPAVATGLEWRLLQEGGGFTSPHGQAGQSLSDVASDGERFVGVGGDGTIMLSADGDQWTAASDSATSASLFRVTWGGGRFVALGNRGTAQNRITAMYSSDGDRWTEAMPISTDSLSDVAWGDGRYVAVGPGGAIMHSADGDSWSAATSSMATSDYVRGLGYDQGESGDDPLEQCR